MYYNLFLDDVRLPSHVRWMSLPPVEWTIVRSYEEFIEVIKSRGLPSRISFDHDLSPEHYPDGPQSIDDVIPYDSYKSKTGYHCALWLANYCISSNNKIPDFTVHSLSLAGKKNITQLLNGAREGRI